MLCSSHYTVGFPRTIMSLLVIVLEFQDPLVPTPLLLLSYSFVASPFLLVDSTSPIFLHGTTVLNILFPEIRPILPMARKASIHYYNSDKDSSF